MDSNSEAFYRQDFSPERDLLHSIRRVLAGGQKRVDVPAGLHFPFDSAIANTYVTLFQEGARPIRWGSKRATLAATLQRVVEKLKNHARFGEFAVGDPDRCRIMLEVVIAEYPCDPRRLTTIRLDENRLEPGIHGLRFTLGGRLYYYMPTDAVTRNLMTVKQVFNHLAKRTGVARETTSITERTRLMRERVEDCRLIRSFAVITWEDTVLPLYRGYPVPVVLDRPTLGDCLVKSSDWLLANMKEDGRFLYYYDPILDTEVDFQHPRMTDPTYYNILRHSGGTITLLRAFELTGEERFLEGAKRSLDFFLTVLREHEAEGGWACYPFFNRKSKLGGAGIGLVALVHYARLSRDDSYRKYMDGLVRHILSRVADDGELIGYFIHPAFNGGREIIDPDLETRRQLFSFYYPGEALLGLVLYLRHVQDIDETLRKKILDKGKKALDFLIHERPRRYSEMFEPLPADGWLMQAIEEWVKIEGFADQASIDFVYNDAQAMIDHMYQEENAPYFDYVGAFYYRYGEHAYPDGARCEGLVAACHLARDLGDTDQAAYFLRHAVKAAKSLLYTWNSEASCYGHRYPRKSVHSFRFKLTRQWVRVDSVQHTACFYARLLPLVTDALIDSVLGGEEEKENKGEAGRIDGFTVLKKIEKGGFATVYLVADPRDPERRYALKRLHKSRYNINRLLREVRALRIMNERPGSIRCHRARLEGGELNLLFDYAGDSDLRRYVRKNGPLDEPELFALTRDILDEILFARERNLLHLDISIFNVIRRGEGFSLLDWGLSNTGPAVRTTVIKGHRTYLAPEIYRGERTFSSEIYSLGATLYFAATGRVIFDIHTRNTPFEQKMFRHLYLEPDFPPELSRRTEYLLRRMLEKDPEKRATVEEIRSIIEAEIPVPRTMPSLGIRGEEPDTGQDTLSLYRKMAVDGIPHAQYRLGTFCEKGEHVAQSVAFARHWYGQAAETRYAPALCGLGLMYLEGRGVERDPARALALFDDAARQGHGRAQFHLARMLEKGIGVAPDPALALSWYRESARNSFRGAIDLLAARGIDLLREHEADLRIDPVPSAQSGVAIPKKTRKKKPASGTVLVPLGDDCQLGAALELWGYQETSLFKWAKISASQLAGALEDGLNEIYEAAPADFYVRPPNGYFGVIDTGEEIQLPRKGGWAPHAEYLRIVDRFAEKQFFHTAVIDRERGFTHGISLGRDELRTLPREEIWKRNREKITYLKKKTLRCIREADNPVFLRAQRVLDREIITCLNRAFLAISKLREELPFRFVVATSDPALSELREFFDLDILLKPFTTFSPVDNPMLLRQCYPEWKQLFRELGLPVQGKFRKTIFFSGFDTPE
ncbi:MAG: hypothetical protein Kow0089_18310 [Desulfobulbaceae bacterium]